MTAKKLTRRISIGTALVAMFFDLGIFSGKKSVIGSVTIVKHSTTPTVLLNVQEREASVLFGLDNSSPSTSCSLSLSLSLECVSAETGLLSDSGMIDKYKDRMAVKIRASLRTTVRSPEFPAK
jgi:hypothetical protein